MLRIYNSLARDLQDFVPIRPGEVRMYVCGMTVYDYCHLGHARMLVAFDMVQRWLRASGYRVTYVRNITDIDDKIIRRARENGEPIEALTARFIRAMDEDIGALGVEKPDHEPRATEHVPGMLDLIRRLETKGLAYQGDDGDVNFPVRKFPGYGKLSGKSIDELRAGERVEISTTKHDPLDFVLWKRSKPDEPSWPSPWGEGRPGWHIECSAMSCALLGDYFDIHGGGQDLQFPHHENEIAQSEGANGRFVNYWMHNGFVRVEEEKMSKSLGNFFIIRDILKTFDPEVVRFFILRAHYRSPLNYSHYYLYDAWDALTRLYLALRGKAVSPNGVNWDEPHAKRFKVAMDDDFNTPEAIAVLFDLANEVNKGRLDLASQLQALGGVLGLLRNDAERFLKRRPFRNLTVHLDDAAVEREVAARDTAKIQKDFATADRIRQELNLYGIVLEDGRGGTKWRRASAYRTVELDELEDFRDAAVRAGYRVQDFRIVERETTKPSTGIFAVTGEVEVTYLPSKKIYRYHSGHATSWVADFEGAALRRRFDR